MKFEEPMRLLLLILIPMLIYLYHISLKRKKIIAIKFGNFDTLKKATVGTLPYKNYVPLILKSLILVSLIITLAGPQTETTIKTTSTDVVLTIDVSGSMLAKDFPPNRLEAAKESAKVFLKELGRGDRVGIVTFSGASYVISPIGEDIEEAEEKIDSIDIGAEDGTAIGDGIITSVSLLGGSIGKKKVIVLLSDGENNRGSSPREAAVFAKNSGVTIYTIGIGTTKGGFIPGTNEVVGLDEELLKDIAESTGGEYSRATTQEALKKIYSEIGKKITLETGTEDISIYFVVIATFLLLTDFILMSTKYRALP